MQLKPGLRLRSVVSTTEVIVLQAPESDVAFSCGGKPMAIVGAKGDRSEPDRQPDGELPGELVPLGARYLDQDLGLEILCTKAGRGEFRCDDRLLEKRVAKPLPSTD